MTARASLLILSFSPLHSDARLLKQINGFAEQYDVTTCGFGPSPHPGVTHIQVDSSDISMSASDARRNDLMVALRRYASAYRGTRYVSVARELLQGRRFDAVLADDLDAVPLAVELFGGQRVHADLHEHWPTVRGHDRRWRMLRSGYYRWLTRRYVPQCASATTVSQGIADEYTREFGFPVGLVTNAAPFRDIEPAPVHEPLRLVYSGVAAADRGLELIIDASARTTTPVTLDLFLVGDDQAYISSLRTRAENLAAPVIFQGAVPYAELAERLRQEDVGFYAPPPINLNHSLALPNKVFDFVQARLGLIVGPSAEMSRMVSQSKVGVVAASFTADALVEALDALTPEAVEGFKAASHAVAAELSAEHQQEGWERPIKAIVDSIGEPAR